MARVPSERLVTLVTILVDNGLVKMDWLDALFASLPPAVTAALPVSDVPRTRLETSLATINDLGPGADGKLPLSLVLSHLTSEAVQAVVDEARRLLALVEVAAAPAPRPITVIDALGHYRVIGDDLFAAREPLRGRLGELTRPDGPAAIVINAVKGQVKVGKSHTLKLLAHAAHTTGEFRLAWVEIAREEAADFTADWLIEELVRSLVPGATGSPPRRTPVARWLGDLASWALDQLGKAGSAPVWMLIDGIGQESVTDEVRGVVERLARSVAAQSGSVRTRLVLIDADTDAIRRHCVAEEERLDHLTVNDAEDALKRLAADTFPELWPVVQAALAAQPSPTTPMVSEVIRESLK